MEAKITKLLERYHKALDYKSGWEEHWNECYEYCLPQRQGSVCENSFQTKGEKNNVNLYDGTACDAVEQLASSLLAELTPPWAKWFGLKAGPELSSLEAEQVTPTLEKTSEVMLQNFEHSNFAVEIHQCYLDLVTAGSACLLFEEAAIGEATAFRFYAVPLREIAIEESYNGRIDTTFRASMVGQKDIEARYPQATLSVELVAKFAENSDYKLNLLEVVTPHQLGGYEYIAFAYEEGNTQDTLILKEGKFSTSPFINFRWMKAPGEIYGRSPVMKALPDIKTANKVVELILKNASISITGIWQADDDGILNPANIKLVPGAIIPKAVGSKGLTPLEAPGRFDVSQLVLDDLRNRINHALLADKLSQVNAPNMTATEVLQRAAEMSRILGATFGRLQSELLTPLLKRAFYILRRRGDILNFDLDGKIVDLQYKSPLALVQAKKDITSVVDWVSMLAQFGMPALNMVNIAETAKWLAKTLNVPANLVNESSGGVVDENLQQFTNQ